MLLSHSVSITVAFATTALLLLLLPMQGVQSQAPQIVTENGDVVFRTTNDVFVYVESSSAPSTRVAVLAGISTVLTQTSTDTSNLRSSLQGTRSEFASQLTAYNTAAQASTLLAAAVAPLITTAATSTAINTAIASSLVPYATTSSLATVVASQATQTLSVVTQVSAAVVASASTVNSTLGAYALRTAVTSEISSSLATFSTGPLALTIASAIGSFPTRAEVNTQLLSYPTTATQTAAISAALVPLATTASVAAQLTGYATLSAQASAIASAVQPLATTAQVSNLLLLYPTLTAQTSSIAAAVQPLVTTTQLTSQLLGYPTTTAQSTAISAAVQPLATTAQVLNLLTNYPNTTVQSAAIAAAVQPLATTTSVTSTVVSALVPYATTAGQTAAIAAAVSGLATTTQVNAAITSAVQSLVTTASLTTTLASYPTTTAQSTAISAAVTAAVAPLPTVTSTSSMIATAVSTAVAPLPNITTTNQLISSALLNNIPTLPTLNASMCTNTTSGRLRMGPAMPEYCARDGSWQPIGSVPSSYKSCYEIKVKTGASTNGWYSITTSAGVVSVYCDMVTEGGGWTLFAVKKTYNFDFTSYAPSLTAVTGAPMNLAADSAGYIPPAVNWNQVLFRFATVQPSVYIVYGRGRGNSNFDGFLEGKTGYDSVTTFDGWYRYTPAGRSPTTGSSIVAQMNYSPTNGISQDHSLTDVWVNMWIGPDGTGSNYAFYDDVNARGTKCISGYCYLNEPIYLMYRETALIVPSPLPSGLWTSCQQLQLFGGVTDSGSYQLIINSVPQDVFCDMSTDGGTWTLYATKISYNFDYWNGPVTTATDRTDLDTSGAVPSTVQWGELLFRFRMATMYVVYSSQYGIASFTNWVMGVAADVVLDTPGFYRYQTPTTRDPVTGFYTILKLNTNGAAGISEDHSGTDGWLDLWSAADTGTPGGYLGDTGAPPRGCKCVAGYCYTSDPVLMMYREARTSLSAGTPIPSRLYATCLEIKTATPSSTTGFYPIACGANICEVYCDMTTDGGGWTLFATKVTPAFDAFSNTFNTASYASTDTDRAGMIPTTTWTQFMVRFKSSTPAVIYNRGSLTSFDSFLMGGVTTDAPLNCTGWYKIVNNVRTPTTGTTTIVQWHFYQALGLSENHGGTDVWVDLWGQADSTNSYIFADSASAWGTKCIAGYCYLNDPVWYMFR